MTQSGEVSSGFILPEKMEEVEKDGGERMECGVSDRLGVRTWAVGIVTKNSPPAESCMVKTISLMLRILIILVVIVTAITIAHFFLGPMIH